MELRVHGGPALLFPSSRDTLCWEQFLHPVDHLLLLRSTGLGSDLAQMREMLLRGCTSLDLLGRADVSKHSSSWASLGCLEELGEHRMGWGVCCVLCWGIGEDDEGTTGEEGWCGDSWPVCTGDIG